MMSKYATTLRSLKARLGDVLLQPDFAGAMAALEKLPARRAVNPLFAFFCSGNSLLRWRAVSGMGALTCRLAKTDMESARVIMRRLMWTLNDESGGIGWGAPEAMGEITAREARLAGEYACILVSYIRPDGNFLEHPMLQRGLLWGLGRLAHSRPAMAAAAAPYVVPFLESTDACHRGHAAWFMRALDDAARNYGRVLGSLAEDRTVFPFYHDGELKDVTVAEVVLEKPPPGSNT
jgi:hypothetical protein